MRTTAPAGNSTSNCTSSTASQGLGPGTPAGCFACARALLKDFVEQTGGSLLEIESTGDLPNIFLRILEEFRQRYLLSYSPRNVARTGWHRIDVRVKNGRVSVKARAGYQSGG